MWGDENMNGIHLETYILETQLRNCSAPVALHCEGGCHFREKFMQLMLSRAKTTIMDWPGGYKLMGDPTISKCSICEIEVPFGSNVEETVEKLSVELKRLQTLAPMVEKTIFELQGEHKQ